MQTHVCHSSCDSVVSAVARLAVVGLLAARFHRDMVSAHRSNKMHWVRGWAGAEGSFSNSAASIQTLGPNQHHIGGKAAGPCCS
jgi:hypothetical protein